MTAGKALGVNDHREMARGSQREFKVQGGVREGGRNTVKENSTSLFRLDTFQMLNNHRKLYLTVQV